MRLLDGIRPRKWAFASVLFRLLLVVQTAIAIKWLALHHVQQPWEEPSHCPQNKVERKKFGLVGSQTRLCKRMVELMPIVTRAAKQATRGCQMLFKDRRWNCSSVDRAPNLTPDLLKGTREQAFVYSFSSAAVLYGVAKGCVSGDLPFCPCGPLPNKHPVDFKWKGCSDNVHYGKEVSRQWADAAWSRRKRGYNKLGKLRKGGGVMADMGNLVSMKTFMEGERDNLTPRLKMNKHNNNVGRTVAENSLVKRCKCHGVSSSCTVKTCWKVLPDLLSIGATLQNRYGRATEVRAMERQPTVRTPDELVPVAGIVVGRVSDTDLVFIKKSPDYCTKDQRFGSSGTVGRSCNATASSHASCDSMCCGRGYDSYQEEVVESCHCKYVHCCYVKCKECRYPVTRYVCK